MRGVSIVEEDKIADRSQLFSTSTPVVQEDVEGVLKLQLQETFDNRLTYKLKVK